ncbi:hypothetical protein [Demequina gelatinilytica]|uniref:hypothetical protein n=1 Tax=Demequina gelatinilytica TaxID=1638980 RepID=UPI000781534E|nr:hypothetical protein [Demequina gelatinilytica]
MTVDTQWRISPGDLAARGLVAGATVLALVGAAWATGSFGGTPLDQVADGALAPGATLLSPAASSAGIRVVIGIGLAAFAVAQAVPMPGSRARVRAASLPMLLAMMLTFAWAFAVQHEALAASILIDAGILASLGWAAAVLVRAPAASILEAAAVDLPVGLYLGWGAAATVSHTTALGAWWLGTPPDAGVAAAAGVLVGTGFLGIAIARDLSPAPVLAWAMTVGFVWVLAWIADGRLHGRPLDAIVGWTALIAGGAVVLTTAVATVAAGIRALRRARRRRGDVAER